MVDKVKTLPSVVLRTRAVIIDAGNDVMYSRAESRFCASFDFVIDVFDLRSDGGKIVPVEVV